MQRQNLEEIKELQHSTCEPDAISISIRVEKHHNLVQFYDFMKISNRFFIVTSRKLDEVSCSLYMLFLDISFLGMIYYFFLFAPCFFCRQ